MCTSERLTAQLAWHGKAKYRARFMRVVFGRLISGRLERKYLGEYGIVTLHDSVRVLLVSLR